MLVHFILLAEAIYVPFLRPIYARNELSIMNSSQIKDFVKKNATIIAMAFCKRRRRTKEAQKAFIGMAKHYSNIAMFVQFEHDDAKRKAIKHGIKTLPVMFFYQNFKLQMICPYLDNENAMNRIFDLFLFPNETQIIINSTELYNYLGSMKFTILAPTPELFQHALKLHRNISQHLGEVDVARVSPDVFTNLSLDPTKMALFRNEDKSIVNFETGLNEYYDDIKSFFNASLPVYRIFQISDIIDPRLQLFCLTSPVLTNEMKDFLFEIAPKYPEYAFGYLGSDFLKAAPEALGVKFSNRLDMHVCNFARRWRIDIDDLFTYEFLRLPFDKKRWTRMTEYAIKLIQKGRQKKYLSEPIPKPNSKSLIKKIVGKTYSTFINDPEHDVLMMYITHCDSCKKFKPVFIDFVKEYHSTGKKFVKFGWIDVEKNAAEIEFPKIKYLPHFELFPAKNKSDHDQLRGERSRDNLVRFLKYKCMEEFPLNVSKPMDKLQTTMQIINMLMNIQEDENEDINKFFGYIFDTANEIDLDFTKIPGFEEYANKLPQGKLRKRIEAESKAEEEMRKEAQEDAKKILN